MLKHLKIPYVIILPITLMQLSEKERILSNQKNLLDTLPDKVLLLHQNGTVEYMNPSARHFFAEFEPTEHRDFKDKVSTVVGPEGFTENAIINKKVVLNKQMFTCLVAPFTGYNGDNLFWLTLKLENADDYHTKPIVPTPEKKAVLIGSSEIMQNLKQTISRVAATDATVLIGGESGTGKELVAHSIYLQSKRFDKPFLTINCNTVNDQLLESDLFGYEKGAFTDATTDKIGKFEAVDGGTIFLDEIGDISPRMQAALLRVIQYGEVFRVGATEPIKVNIRIIAATNHDLVKAVKTGNFRLDLFYRLSTFHIQAPALRDRLSDLPELVDCFVTKYSVKFNKPIPTLSNDLLESLSRYNWPGNIRELENVIQRAILTSRKNTITASDLIFNDPVAQDPVETLASVVQQLSGYPLKQIIEHVEKAVIIDVMSKYKGNVAKSSAILQLSKAALYDKMKRHDLNAKYFAKSTSYG